MFEGLTYLGQGIASILTPLSIFNVAWATLLGITIGILPGLTATMGVALLVTFTYPMPPDQAILTLMCVYLGAIYGGSRTAIVLNIPGTAANAAACLDGYQLARKGQAGRAMGIATCGSVAGSLFGIVCLALLTPSLGEAALSFGAFEFFWLALFGVMMSGSITGSDPLKGWLMGFAGLFVAQIGQDGLHAHDRFTFGYNDLSGGPSLIPALVPVLVPVLWPIRSARIEGPAMAMIVASRRSMTSGQMARWMSWPMPGPMPETIATLFFSSIASS